MSESLKEKLKSPTITTPLLVIFVVLFMQASKLAFARVNSDTNLFLAIGVIQLVVLALPCMVYYLIKGRRLDSPMLIVPKNGPQLLFLIFAALFFISGMLLLKYFYFVYGGQVASLVNFYQDFSGTTEGSGNLEIILSLIIIPAFCEELFFRGIVFSEYRRYGTANAIIISAVCFAMLHFSVENMAIYLFSGLLFGFVTAVTRSIIPSIALHLLSNTLSIYASDAFLRVTVIKNGAFFIGFVLAVLTALTLIFLLSRVESICIGYAERPPIEEIPPKSIKNAAKVFFSPTFILLTVIFIIFSLLT
ncbi:MAG: CPBP family intramembrane metalloprotease [Clostridia bacterium]|nr:CPBP family intramembrane metalloprotease [Clostridia bacterium]